MESSINKQCISFKMHTILSSKMKSHGIQLCPAKGLNNPFVRYICSVLYMTPSGQSLSSRISCQINCLVLQSLCSSNPHFTKIIEHNLQKEGTCTITEGIKPLQQHFDELKNKIQLLVTIFFQKDFFWENKKQKTKNPSTIKDP